MSENETLSPTVAALQEAQQRFDQSRGFDFAGVSDLDRAVFAALALSGEVGELANAMKKAQRASWLGDTPDAHLRRASEELGDILAYLLKIASILGVPLSHAYLTKMSTNCLRFPSRSVPSSRRVVTLAGPSCVGKTTVANLLSSHCQAFLESSAGNPFLSPLLAGSSDFNALENQRWFLGRVASFVRAATPADPLVIDQDPAAIVRVYGKMFYDQGFLSGVGYESLLLELLEVEEHLAKWGRMRIMVFLDASAPVLFGRAKSRGNTQLGVDWYERCREYFRAFQKQVQDASYVISTENCSPESVAQQIQELAQA